MPKVLFIGTHRFNRSPSQRFRFEQYFSYLRSKGFECSLSPLLNESDDAIFYSQGNILKKIRIAIISYFKRKKDLRHSKKYDIVFIQREAFMTGSAFFEKSLKRKNVKIVYDFDDAIWLPNISENNKKFEWLKNPSKTSELINLADLVIAGSNFLAEYAFRFNKNVEVIPTTIDTSYHINKNLSKEKRICIGWTGSHTTIPHFELAVPALISLMNKYGDTIYFKVIGDETYQNDRLGVRGNKWNLQDEIEQLSEINIGIMPLPDDEWAKGKCGLKGLQYMALEIPCVMSPVGVNRAIVTDGVNGFLAGNEAEWIEKISLLIENPELRKKMGHEARKTVEERYSVNSQKERYLSLLQRLIEK